MIHGIRMIRSRVRVGVLSAFVASAAMALGAAAPVRANIVIVPTYAASITSDANSATIIATINAAIAEYEAKYADPITVHITFQEGGGLGSSSTAVGFVSYAGYRAKLIADATTADDATALANISAGPANGVDGGSFIILTTANARAVGISAAIATDGTITLNTSIMNLTRPPGNPAFYDLKAVAQHEMDEVLGLGSGLNLPVAFPRTARAEDLFRYTAAGAATFTTAGDDAFFSINGGVTDLARFNQNSGGDYGDWWSVGAHTPKVQDAFGTPNAVPDLSVELRALDVIGYNFVAVPEPASFVLLAVGAVLIISRRRTQVR